ncbi:hypothetical protein [Dongia sp. agr-C8]
MVRRGGFQGLRQRGAVLGAVLAFALLLNAFAAAAFNLQAVAAALDPLTEAATCDTSGNAPAGDPVRHQNQHQPDCTLCSAACPMGGMAQAPDGGGAVALPPPSAFVLRDAVDRHAPVNPASVYLSDADAQAPPGIG